MTYDVLDESQGFVTKPWRRCAVLAARCRVPAEGLPYCTGPLCSCFHTVFQSNTIGVVEIAREMFRATWDQNRGLCCTCRER